VNTDREQNMTTQENAEENADDKKNRSAPIRVQDLINAGWGSKNTIYKAIKCGQIKSFRIGGNIIIDHGWAREHMGW
jgi:hypothetical protein